jgi:hypothetical protein
MNEQAAVDRAVKAKALLDNELLQEAFAAVEKGVFDKIKNSKPDEREARERLYLALGLAEEVQSLIRGWLGSGQIAAQNIEKLKKRQ